MSWGKGSALPGFPWSTAWTMDYMNGVIVLEMKRMNIRVPSDMHEWVKKQSERRGVTMSAIVIMALENYMMAREMGSNLTRLEEILKKVENK